MEARKKRKMEKVQDVISYTGFFFVCLAALSFASAFAAVGFSALFGFFEAWLRISFGISILSLLLTFIIFAIGEIIP